MLSHHLTVCMYVITSVFQTEDIKSVHKEGILRVNEEEVGLVYYRSETRISLLKT